MRRQNGGTLHHLRVTAALTASTGNGLVASSPSKNVQLVGQKCDQRKLACSAGDSPVGGIVGAPVAWVAFVEETKRMKPADKAIFGMVSESLGRNASEPSGGLDKQTPEAEPPSVGRRLQGVTQTD